MKKDSLIQKLRKASKQNIDIAEAERFVGQKSIISTLEGNGWEVLKRADITEDEQQEEILPALSETSNIIYWKQKDEKSFTRIAGLWWDRENKPHIFYGIIYPP